MKLHKSSKQEYTHTESKAKRKKRKEGEKRESWLSRLFGLCPDAPVEKKVKKQRRDKLTDEAKRNLVTDKLINKMTQKAIADKYGISTATVRKYLRRATR